VDGTARLAAMNMLVHGIGKPNGPSLIEAHTIRWVGHFEGDPQAYRGKDEVAEGRRTDPVARLARLVVVPRNSTGFDPEAPAAQKVLKELGLPGFRHVTGGSTGSDAAPAQPAGEATPPAPLLVRAASLPISGSDLRRRAREGRSLAYRMPEPVAAYIRDHRLYRADA